MLLYVTLGIAIFSIIFAIRSLSQLEAKKEIAEVKNELSKGKVIYQSDSSSLPEDVSPSSSSSS